jgi:hypothetical protein
MSDNSKNNGREIASFENANMQGQAALTAALLINGGASVALLAFVGTMMVKDMQKCLLLSLCFSMLWFVLGVLCAAIASGVTYVTGLINARWVDVMAEPTDTSNANEKEISKLGLRFWVFNSVAIILVISSYVLFFIGFLNAYFAFTTYLIHNC